MDRFLFKVRVDYPEAAAEQAIVRMLQVEEGGASSDAQPVGSDVIFAARKRSRKCRSVSL